MFFSAVGKTFSCIFGEPYIPSYINLLLHVSLFLEAFTSHLFQRLIVIVLHHDHYCLIPLLILNYFNISSLKEHQLDQISRQWTHHITTVLFFCFGLWSLWEAFTGDGESEELAEVEAKLDTNWKSGSAGSKVTSKDSDDLKKGQKKFLTQLFSPIFLKAFSITFFGEWGDKSQIATIGLASDTDPFGVVLGGIIGQALCTTAAVLGGKSLATQISEKMVSFSGGVLFLVFGVQSFLASSTK